MDPNLPPSPILPSTPGNQPLSGRKLSDVLKNKKLLLIGGVVLLVLLVLIAGVLLSGSKETTQPKTETTNAPTSSITQSVSPTMSPDESQALKEQLKIDADYGSALEEVNTQYPWFNNLPLRGEKYFVYFDLQKKVLIGLLYPKAGDNVEAMKIQVQNELKQRKKVPVEKYPIEWTVTPE
jgi:hypothetical protein